MKALNLLPRDFEILRAASVSAIHISDLGLDADAMHPDMHCLLRLVKHGLLYEVSTTYNWSKVLGAITHMDLKITWRGKRVLEETAVVLEDGSISIFAELGFDGVPTEIHSQLSD